MRADMMSADYRIYCRENAREMEGLKATSRDILDRENR